jgi:hypothetical protein
MALGNVPQHSGSCVSSDYFGRKRHPKHISSKLYCDWAIWCCSRYVCGSGKSVHEIFSLSHSKDGLANRGQNLSIINVMQLKSALRVAANPGAHY